MTDELTEEDLEELRRSVHAANTLTNVFLFQADSTLMNRNPAAYRLVEKMMQRSVNYEGKYAYAYRWVSEDTVRRYMQEYLQEKGAKKQKMGETAYLLAWKDIGDLLETYYVNTQAEMNTSAYIEMNFHTYSTIAPIRKWWH